MDITPNKQPTIWLSARLLIHPDDPVNEHTLGACY